MLSKIFIESVENLVIKLDRTKLFFSFSIYDMKIAVKNNGFSCYICYQMIILHNLGFKS